MEPLDDFQVHREQFYSVLKPLFFYINMQFRHAANIELSATYF